MRCILLLITLLTTGCAAIPGSRLSPMEMPNIDSMASIDYESSPKKRPPYVATLVASALVENLIKRNAPQVDDACRVKVTANTKARNSPIESAVFYANIWVSTATLYLVPAYLRTTYTTEVTIQDREGNIVGARSFTESEHMLVHLAAGFIRPGSRFDDDGVQHEIARRLSAHVVAEVITALNKLPCASNHSLQARRP